MKKIISLILAVVMIATFVPLAFAGSENIPNTTGEVVFGDFNCYIDRNNNGKFDEGVDETFLSVEEAIEADAADYSKESKDNPTKIELVGHEDKIFVVGYGRYISIDANGYGFINLQEDHYIYRQSVITNRGNLSIKNGMIKDCTSSQGGAIYNESGSTLDVSNCTFIDNTSENGGGAVVNYGTATFTNCTFKGNTAEQADGGAISNSSDLIIKNCTFTENTAAGNGGAISTTGGTKCVLLNTDVFGNAATKNGNGVYYGKTMDCIVAGTKITMADDTTKNVEDIEVGDVVKTFDHEAGDFSSAKVYYAYKNEEAAETFELTFDNGSKVECITSYSFLEKASKKYIELTNENATSHIGECFYGEDGGWHKLESVAFGSTDCVYEIYTAKHNNVIVNGILSAPADVDYLINIYELDANLKADATQLAKDIEAYGLVSYEYASALCDMNKEWYGACGVKYVFVAIGKGLTTMEECFDAYSYAGKLTSVDKFDNSVLTIGAGTKIYNNGEDNVYLLGSGLIEIHGDIAGTSTNVGVTLANTTGQFTTNGTFDDLKYFFSDNEDYGVLYNKDGYLEINNHTTCDFGEWKTTKDATCEATGTKTRTCSVCGKEETETIKALGHDIYFEAEVISKPTCTTKGVTNNYEKCRRCNHKELSSMIMNDATGHTPSEKFEDTDSYIAPTCEEDGSIEVVTVCTKCGKELSRDVVKKGDALGHNFYYPVKNDTLPTCTEDGHNNIYKACTRCDYYKLDEIETLPKTGHNLTDWTVVTKATCTTEGLKRRNCTKCNYDEEETIVKTAHVAGEWEVTKAATETEAGVKVKKCVNCGEVVSEDFIEKLPKKDEPTTEEDTTKKDYVDDTEYSDICLICGRDHHGNMFQNFICLIVTLCRKISAYFNKTTYGPGAEYPLL